MLSLALLAACADAANDEQSAELQRHLQTSAASPAADAELLNLAFSSLAVRAHGYAEHLPQSAPALWSPVVSVDANGPHPVDVSEWIASGDIDAQGVFAPCRVTTCTKSALSAENRALLRESLDRGAAEDCAERIQGGALRLWPHARHIRWVESSNTGIAWHAASQTVELNARLLSFACQSGAVEPSASAGSEARLPDQNAGAPRITGAPLRNHEPPPGYQSDSDGCDCNLINIDCSGDSTNKSNDSCAISARTGDTRRRRYLNLNWLFAVAAVVLVKRRQRRSAERRRELDGPSKRLLLRGLFSALLLFSIMLPVSARAQTAEATTHLNAGKAQLARSDYAAAITELEAARAAGAGRAVVEPLAKAYEGAGRLPEAYVLLGDALADAALKNPERDRLQKQAQNLEPRLAFINVQVEPANASVLIDGATPVVDPRSKQYVIIPGQRRVSASASGFAAAEQMINAAPASRNTIVNLKLTADSASSVASATFQIRAFATDAVIAIDGVPIARGYWSGPVTPGPHLVQVYQPGGQNYEFRVTAVAGKTEQIPPPGGQAVPISEPAPPNKPRHKYRVGPYVLAHVGILGMTAKPDGFRYDVRKSSDNNTEKESGGAALLVGATGGFRLSRGVGVGGLLMYGRGGGDGTVKQVEANGTGGYLAHEGPADFLQQFVRISPHFRFMAGGDRARFLVGLGLGTVYSWIDLDHVDVVVANGALSQRGTYHHDYGGWNPFWTLDMGAEFNLPSNLLLGIAFDVFVDGTGNISGDPFGGTAQGYLGLSARIGVHNWTAE
jgi:hypothetical protein